MSAMLESLLDDERLSACAANDTEMLPLRRFRVNIGQRGDPRMAFECMAPDSVTAVMQHVCLAEVGERCEVEAVQS
jgi:hypothetical protein